MKNEEMIWEFLYEKIKNPFGVAALMGNLFAESSLNPTLANGIKKYGLTSEEYTRLVDEEKKDNFAIDGIAYGLAQWCYYTRKQGLLEKAKMYNKSIGDLQIQLEYLVEELKKYTTVYKTLLNATSIREASDIILQKYEKPANQSDSVKEKRASYGQMYFQKYNAQQKVSLQKKTAKTIFTALQKLST